MSKFIDFVGFTYNNIHSSDLGIVRVSDGSRFNENLLPTIQDKTVQVPGGDGTYFFGSYYTQKQFTVSFAFDKMTEEQLALFKKTFGDKKIHSLIFDELPFKVYQAKVTGTASIKHLAFSEGATNRVYKGEGSIQFTAYNPFATSRYKILDQYSDYTNQIEWANASGILTKDEQKAYEVDYVSYGRSSIVLHNPGVKESDFIFTIKFKGNAIPAGALTLSDNSKTLTWSAIQSIGGNDAYIKINTKLNLVEGYTSDGKKTGNIYNRYFTGTFFKIPVCEKEDGLQMILSDFGGSGNNWIGYLPESPDTQNKQDSEKVFIPLEYNYYYF